MKGDHVNPEHASRAEERLSEHLAVLRSDPPRSEQALVPRVVRAARWQAALRGPLLAVGRLASALRSGFLGLLGTGAWRR